MKRKLNNYQLRKKFYINYNKAEKKFNSAGELTIKQKLKLFDEFLKLAHLYGTMPPSKPDLKDIIKLARRINGIK